MTACDHKSVGVVLTNPEGQVLLIERARFPFFWAPPAGHVDDHGDVLQAAIEETKEEVGIALAADSLRRAIDSQRMTNNRCRRSPDGWHDWTVFVATIGDVAMQLEPDEVKQMCWADPSELATMAYDDIYPRQLEPVWRAMFEQLGIITPKFAV